MERQGPWSMSPTGVSHQDPRPRRTLKVEEQQESALRGVSSEGVLLHPQLTAGLASAHDCLRRS